MTHFQEDYFQKEVFWLGQGFQGEEEAGQSYRAEEKEQINLVTENIRDVSSRSNLPALRVGECLIQNGT